MPQAAATPAAEVQASSTTVTSSSIGTIVRLADGTTVRLVNPVPQHLGLNPGQPASPSLPWTGLLGALALTSAAMLGAAATLFALWVRPILQASNHTIRRVQYKRLVQCDWLPSASAAHIQECRCGLLCWPADARGNTGKSGQLLRCTAGNGCREIRLSIIAPVHAQSAHTPLQHSIAPASCFDAVSSG